MDSNEMKKYIIIVIKKPYHLQRNEWKIEYVAH